MTSLVVVLVILGAVYVGMRLAGERGRREEPLFPKFRPEAAAKIAIRGKGKEVALEKRGDSWLVVSEDSLPSEPDAVANMLARIQSFSRKDMISSDPEKHSLYRVDTTGVAVWVEDGRGRSVASFIVGKVGADVASTYVRVADSDEVILAPGGLTPVFDRGARSWQDKRIFALDQAALSEITLVRSGETALLARDAVGQWYLSSPDSAACDAAVVGRLVRTLAGLRAEDFGRGPGRATAGLDSPTSRIDLKMADGNMYTLLLGNQDEKQRTYARREDRDIVYLISGSTVKSLSPDLATLKQKETGQGSD